MRILIALLTFFAVTLISPKVFSADEPRSERGSRVRERMSETMADLHLTDDQEAKIAEIRKESRPKIQEAAKELSAIEKEEMDKVRAALTPEQREKLKELKDERKERRADCLAARIAHL